MRPRDQILVLFLREVPDDFGFGKGRWCFRRRVIPDARHAMLRRLRDRPLLRTVRGNQQSLKKYYAKKYNSTTNEKNPAAVRK
jgi:hypothetical protein